MTITGSEQSRTLPTQDTDWKLLPHNNEALELWTVYFRDLYNGEVNLEVMKLQDHCRKGEAMERKNNDDIGG